jgi:hypothetical protein
LLSGRGSVITSVEVIARAHGGYLHMRASRASWVAVVACCECIKLCSGDVSHLLLVTSHWFISIVGPVFWSLPHRFLLLGGLQMASRTSWILCWTWESCIIISSIAEGEVARSRRGRARKMIYSLSYFIRVSTVALRAAVSAVDWR